MLNYETLLADASQLPVADRIQLIEALWETVPQESLPPLSDEWMAEILNRTREFDSGTVATVSWEEVRREALARIAR